MLADKRRGAVAAPGPMEKFLRRIDLTAVEGVLQLGSSVSSPGQNHDYDVAVVAKYDFVIPAGFYTMVARAVAGFNREHGKPADVLLLDRAIPGTRFSSIGSLFRRHLDEYGRVVAGSDIRQLMTNSMYHPGAFKSSEELQSLNYIVSKLVLLRRHASQLESYVDRGDSGFLWHLLNGEALKLHNFAYNVLIHAGHDITFGDKAGIFSNFRVYVDERLADEMVALEGKRGSKEVRQLPPEQKMDLYYRALNLREEAIKLLVRREEGGRR